MLLRHRRGERSDAIGRAVPAGAQARDDSQDGQLTTAVTLGELTHGAAKRGSAELGAQIHELVASRMPILPFDRAAADVFGPLRARLESEGQRLDEPDLRIAAIVLSRDLTLVTGNVRHFERVPGLRVENWLEPRRGV